MHTFIKSIFLYKLFICYFSFHSVHWKGRKSSVIVRMFVSLGGKKMKKQNHSSSENERPAENNK